MNQLTVIPASCTILGNCLCAHLNRMAGPVAILPPFPGQIRPTSSPETLDKFPCAG
jgi:hypothetical protein